MRLTGVNGRFIANALIDAEDKPSITQVAV
jgi:hypothetical protein